MMKLKVLFTYAILFAAILPPAMAADYYVSKSGNNANNGKTPQAAFLTVVKGVNALQPGDTLQIAPGEYAESITRDGLGDMSAQTVIKAEIPGTVLLRGDIPLDSSTFQKVDGYRYIYAAPFAEPVQGINEVDTLSRLKVFPSLAELDYSPGTSFYDAGSKQIYISTSDLSPPNTHQYTVSVIDGSGLMLTNPRRVTIEGIAAAGFRSSKLLPSYPGHWTVWGIMLAGARQCVIRDCTAYFNGSGLGFDSDASKSKDGIDNGWNIFENCRAFSNGSNFAGEAGNIIGFNSNHDTMRNCYAFLGSPNSLRFYGAGIRGPAIMKNNISWGGTYTDTFIKGGQATKYGLAENCITLGIFHSTNVKNSIIGTINQYNRNPGKDTIYGLFSSWGNQEKAQANRDQSFADPENLDFRLQATSPYRGSGPGGKDRGAFPYQTNIFYVSSRGSDTNDGLSTKNPWKTLAHAVTRLRAGDTLYLEKGVYQAAGELTIANDDGKSTFIRGRGTDPVIIEGSFHVADSSGLQLERLNFTGTVSIKNSRRITFNNCRFSNDGSSLQADVVQELKVTHGEFNNFSTAAIRLQDCSKLWLSGNIFDNPKAPAIQMDQKSNVLYSDYNSYANADLTWQVAGTKWNFAKLQERQDKYSRVRKPQVDDDQERSAVITPVVFGAGGADGSKLGFYRPYHMRKMHISAPLLHSVSDTTANLEWWTSVPAVTEIAWGETPDTPHSIVFNKDAQTVKDGFNTLSLTGLKPGRKYFFRLVNARPLDQHIAQYTQPVTLIDAPLTFETDAVPAATRTLYVAPDGKDTNSGLSREQAWKTVTHAGDAARAGDTILIAGGTYAESVRVRASGSLGKPITFKAVPGEKVVFDGNERSIVTAFSVIGKQYIHFDGLYFQQFGAGGWKSILDLRQDQHLQITRCFFNAYGKGTPGTQIRTDQCTDITVRNCVISRGFQGMYFTESTQMHIENNVFMNNLICAILNSGGGPGDIQVRNNIFVDSIPYKVKIHLFELGGFDQYAFTNNAFYLRVPDEERQPFLFYASGPGRISIADYDKKAGLTNLIVDDPQFAITRGQEPVDRNGKK